MDFVKKHYEKIILSVVLLGLVGALVFLPFMIASDKHAQEEAGNIVLSPKVAPLPEIDVTGQSNILARLHSPNGLDLSTTNRVFNPLEWQRGADNNLIKLKTGNEVGLGALVVTKITPLYLALTFDGVQTNELSTVYIIGVEKQAAPTPALRRKQQRYAAVNEKKDAFTLVKAEGAPENPSQLVLKLADTGEMVTVTRQKPYQRADAYAVDLRYDPEKKNFTGRREGASVSFGGEDYIIVAIHQNEVILLAQSNQKKTTKKYAP